jgi:hypothetical protein
MSTSTKVSSVAVAIAMALGSPGSNASPAGMTGVATEATQLLNNIELATQTLKQIRSMEELIQSTILHTKNWRQLLLTNLPLGQGDVVASTGDLALEIGEFQRYQTSLTNAGSSVEQLRQAIDARAVQASLRGTSFNDYINQEAVRIAEGNKQAKQRLITEKSIIDRANVDLNVAVANSETIHLAKGPTEAIGMLNRQVNQLVQQNARMSQIIANATGTEQALVKEKEAFNTSRASDAAQRLRQAETDSHQQSINAIKANKVR